MFIDPFNGVFNMTNSEKNSHYEVGYNHEMCSGWPVASSYNIRAPHGIVPGMLGAGRSDADIGEGITGFHGIVPNGTFRSRSLFNSSTGVVKRMKGGFIRVFSRNFRTAKN